MSTILDALRKAKDSPPPLDSVDAKREILSHSSHDYLASAGRNKAQGTQSLKIAILVMAVLISILLVVVIVLLTGKDTSAPAAASQTVTAAQVDTASHNQVPQPTPPPAAPQTVQLIITTPQATPTTTPVPTPTPAPTTPPVTPTPLDSASINAQLNDIRVDAIVHDDANPLAMINGRMVRVGEKVQGYAVTRIERNAVWLDVDGLEFEITY